MADHTAEQQSMPLENDAHSAASQLSAIIDDELAEREISLVLRRLSRDRDLQDRWERYYLVSDVLQGHLPDVFDRSFASRVRQAVEAEPLLQPIAKPLPTWYKPVTGFGLAASVVMVTLFGFKLTQTENTFATSSTPQLATAIPLSPSTPLAIQTTAGNRYVNSANEPVETRLNNYLVNHNNYASLNGVHGMLPYVRMVGYQANR